MDAQNVFATEVPKKFLNNPRTIEAKKEGIRRWKEYDTVGQVSHSPDAQVL